MSTTATANHARTLILEAANDDRPAWARPLTMKHINRAVNICRQRKLVPDTVLEHAGFNPTRKRK